MMRLVWKEATQAIQDKLDALSLSDVLKMAQREVKLINKDGQVGQDKEQEF
jgi:DNA-binding IscR family transcriptional regulator